MARIKPKGSILCLGGGIESLYIIKELIRLSYHPIVFDGNPKCAVAKFVHRPSNRELLTFIEANCYSSRAIIETMTTRYGTGWRTEGKPSSRLLGGEQAEARGILCCGVDAPDTAAWVAHKFHKHHPLDIAQAKLGTDKYNQWKALSEASINVPKTILLTPESQWSNELLDCQVIKPVDSRGARGVRLFDKDTFSESLIEALSYSRKKQAIAQTYVEGDQYSVEATVYNGEVLMLATALRNYDKSEYHPYLIENGSNAPGNLSERHRDIIKRTLTRAVAALGWNNITVKADLVIEGNLVWVIELAPRLSGGFFASHIIPNSTGWNVIADAAALACGKKPPVKVSKRPHLHNLIVQRYFFPKPEWIGRRIIHLPFITDIGNQIIGRNDYLKRVLLTTWNYHDGEIIRSIKSHPDRLGQITVRGDDGFIDGAVEKITNEILIE